MLSALLLFAFALTPIHARPAIDLWKLPVNDPAPSAELGPPGAAKADRNPSHLKYDVLGIVGAYLIWILGTVLLVFFLGRRLRSRNLAVTNGSVKLKMFKLQGKPGPKDLRLSPKDMREPGSSKVVSPDSPGKSSSIRSWGRKAKDKEPRPHDSVQSISTVGSAPKDEAHEAKNREQLSDLYAHVMAQDERKTTTQSRVISIPPPSPLDDEDDDNSNPSTPREEQEHLYHSNKLSHPLAPTPRDDQFDDDAQYSRHNRPRKSKPLALISELGTRAGNLMSPRRPRHISVKGSRISQPMASAGLGHDDMYADNVPLSPRLYNPGPPPLTPQQRRQQLASTLPDDEENQGRPQTRERKVPPSLALRKEASNNASSPNKALPFRETFGDHSLASAPATRTTFVERPGRTNGGPRTGVVPQTPYSAYMPYTPITPITPGRLVGKAEMKRNKKEAKLKVLSEDDLVVPEDKGY